MKAKGFILVLVLSILCYLGSNLQAESLNRIIQNLQNLQNQNSKDIVLIVLHSNVNGGQLSINKDNKVYILKKNKDIYECCNEEKIIDNYKSAFFNGLSEEFITEFVQAKRAEIFFARPKSASNDYYVLSEPNDPNLKNLKSQCNLAYIFKNAQFKYYQIIASFHKEEKFKCQWITGNYKFDANYDYHNFSARVAIWGEIFKGMRKDGVSNVVFFNSSNGNNNWIDIIRKDGNVYTNIRPNELMPEESRNYREVIGQWSQTKILENSLRVIQMTLHENSNASFSISGTVFPKRSIDEIVANSSRRIFKFIKNINNMLPNEDKLFSIPRASSTLIVNDSHTSGPLKRVGSFIWQNKGKIALACCDIVANSSPFARVMMNAAIDLFNDFGKPMLQKAGFIIDDMPLALIDAQNTETKANLDKIYKIASIGEGDFYTNFDIISDAIGATFSLFNNINDLRAPNEETVEYFGEEY
jgi:hypothetical protein